MLGLQLETPYWCRKWGSGCRGRNTRPQRTAQSGGRGGTSGFWYESTARSL